MGSLFLQKQPTMDFSFPPEKFPQDISLLGAIFMTPARRGHKVRPYSLTWPRCARSTRCKDGLRPPDLSSIIKP